MTQWTYEQTTGRMSHDGVLVGTGYSGRGSGKDNPEMEDVVGVGPIPRGQWHIGPAYDHPHLGPVVMNLTPVGHDAHGRSAFRIHGDSIAHPGEASDGCIIQGHDVREKIASSADRVLLVVR